MTRPPTTDLNSAVSAAADRPGETVEAAAAVSASQNSKQPGDSSERAESTRPMGWTTAGYLIAAVAVVVVGWSMQDPNGYAICNGITAGQLVLLGAWLALGPSPWPLRVLQVMGAAATTILIDLWFLVSASTRSEKADLVGLLFLVLGSLGLLFVLLRGLFCWRIVPSGNLAEPQRRQFSIRQMLAATAVIAVLAGAARADSFTAMLLASALGCCVLLAPAAGMVGVALATQRRVWYLVPSGIAAIGWFLAWVLDNGNVEILTIFSLAYVVAHGVALLLLLQLRADGYRLQSALPWQLKRSAADRLPSDD